MNTFVSGESDAKGLSVILPYIAFDRADVAIRRPGHFYNQHNPMEQTHSNALMNYAGALYLAYMGAAKKEWPEIFAPAWADFVCDPLNKVSVKCWIAVAKVAVKMENNARDSAL